MKKTVKKVVGGILVATPFVLLFIVGVAKSGLAETVVAWITTGVVIGMIFGGLSLIEDDDA